MASLNDLAKWTTSDVDFYELLGITFEHCGESELKRAYRKTALKYHPDKLGKDFDPDKYELFNAAYEVLQNPELKTKYDNHRNAKLQKQRANALFEGKRRQMKDDLEARERGEKRPREDGAQRELQRLAEEGRKRKAARTSMMGDSIRAEAASSPVPKSFEKTPAPVSAPTPPTSDNTAEDEIARLERLIREKTGEKAKRKADKKARKSGIYVAADSPSVGVSAAGTKWADQDIATPTKHPDVFRGLKADEKPSASPKFSFSPSTVQSNTPRSNDFAATMARLKAAEKQRLEDEIRKQDAADLQQAAQ